MKAAMKVLNDSLLTSTSTDVAYQMKNAINIIQQEWFKVNIFHFTYVQFKL
jgi:hypothetical protein